MQFALGSKVRDTVTGCAGTVTARIEYLSDTPQAKLEWGTPDGTHHERWIPESRLEAVAS
ncbi:hypothetical protein K2Z84_05220 [Candidatus Binatia bacterium]|nr:hypothetical protein [Candidatus Binatia bacterium]